MAPRLARRRARAGDLLAVAERVIDLERPLAAPRTRPRRREPRLAGRPDRDRVLRVLALVRATVGRSPGQGRKIEVECLGAELASRGHARAGLTLTGEDDQLVLVVEEGDVARHEAVRAGRAGVERVDPVADVAARGASALPLSPHPPLPP